MQASRVTPQCAHLKLVQEDFSNVCTRDTSRDGKAQSHVADQTIAATSARTFNPMTTRILTIHCQLSRIYERQPSARAAYGRAGIPK